MNYIKIILRKIHSAGLLGTAITIKRRFLCGILGYPHSIMFEASSVCNLKCAMCWAYKASFQRQSKFMRINKFEKIIDDVSFFCTNIFFSFCGEPLLNREIFGMISYAKKKHITVDLSTNAMLLDEDACRKLLEAGPRKIIVSLDAVSEDAYLQMRIGGDVKTAMENVRRLARIKLEKKISDTEIDLQMVYSQVNKDDIGKFVDFAGEIGVGKVTVKSLFIDHHGDKAYVEKLENNFFIEHEISRYKRQGDGRLVLKELGECPNIHFPVISSDCCVVPCCFDIYTKYSQGNAFTGNFCKIWNERKYKDFRSNMMKNRKMEMCKYCGYKGMPDMVIMTKTGG